jgi:hypothetical protein
MPGGCDPAGIPYRGSEVFRELMDGRPIEELRAAYVTFRRLNCQSGLIDALEFARGVMNSKESSANSEQGDAKDEFE